MIIVDSSVWVDYFNGKRSSETDALHNLLGQEEIILGDLILTEVLQGFRSDMQFREAKQLLEAFTVVTMMGKEMAIKAAKNYRSLRKAGSTVRKIIDVIIGTYCIEEGLSLLYADRDFDLMVTHLNLHPVLPTS